MRWTLATLAALASLWALGAWMAGGLAFSVAGIRVSSSDPTRPLIVAAIALGAYVLASGIARTFDEILLLRAWLTQRRRAALLTAAILAIGLTHNSWSAGGPDSYSYVTAADLWLRGDLKVRVPIADAAPWPNALGTFTPLGYRTSPAETAIVPMTGPGLPLLMAMFKGIAGHPAMFLVVPLTGALLVWTTFLIGVRLGSGDIGLGGAWLLATSPTFLMMFKSQMSDVPAAAFWALATYWILGRTARSALAAGLAASVAILVRPNLVPIAAVLALWPLVEAGRAFQARLADPKGPRRTMNKHDTANTPATAARTFQVRVAAFALATLPGCLAVAAINNWLYGSPFSSGYGDLSTLFSLSNVPTTLSRYGRWLIDTQTPLASVSIIVLALAPQRVWPDERARHGARLLAIVFAVVWALYAVYAAFDAWWFLRFLLPSWPALCIGTAALVVWLFEGRAKWGRTAALVVTFALGINGIVVARARDVFPAGEGERRYATIAKLVEQQTEPSAMILASMHAGPVRYYAGRATMRFDQLDEAWLDRAAGWLQQQGRHPYVLVEDWEMPMFEQRFGGKNRLGGLRLAPVLAYRAYQVSGTIYLFDLLRPDGPTLEPPPIRDPRPRCVEPATPPALTAGP